MQVRRPVKKLLWQHERERRPRTVMGRWRKRCSPNFPPFLQCFIYEIPKCHHNEPNLLLLNRLSHLYALTFTGSHASNEGDWGSIPGRGTKIATCCTTQPKNKQINWKRRMKALFRKTPVHRHVYNNNNNKNQNKHLLTCPGRKASEVTKLTAIECGSWIKGFWGLII